MMKKISRWGALTLLSFLPLNLFADQQFIVDYFQKFRTLEANFTQEIITKDRTDTTSGHLIIEKVVAAEEESNSSKKVQEPKFVFDYTEPYHQILVSNGSKFWFYDVDLMQVIIKPLKEVVNNPVLKILLGNQRLDESFNIQTIRPKREYLLTPKVIQEGLEVKDIQVIFANRKIYSFEVEDVTGQKISFVMKKVAENREIDPTVFDFTIPKDVDVIDETK